MSVHAWWPAFIWTLALELPIYSLLLSRHCPRWSTRIAIILGLNVLTHPALWFVFPRFEPFALWFGTAELGVILVEGIALSLIVNWRVGFTAATAANVFSAAVGLWLYSGS